MEGMGSFLRGLGGLCWGPWTCVLILSVGAWLTVRCGFFQFRYLGLWWRETWGSLQSPARRKGKGVTPFRALSAALSGTLGTGNIAGTAVALAAGGPGALFWMWISALLGMMTKYTEILLAVRWRIRDKDGHWMGGPMVVLERALGRRRWGAVFAFACMLSALGMGSAVQGNTIAAAAEAAWGVQTWQTALVLVPVCGAVILGGVERITAVSEKLMPAMTVFYILGTLLVIGTNIRAVPEVFGQIFAGAFGLGPAAAGVSGHVMGRAVSAGISKGVFSNEAGLGSSSLVHAASTETAPVRQAMWGCFEVFADTILVCTLTGVALLSSGVLGRSDAVGAALAVEAFSTGLGHFSGPFLCVTLALFAFSSICSWAHYGAVCWRWLFGAGEKGYLCLVLLACGGGCLSEPMLLWSLGDVLNVCMAVPNLVGVLSLSGQAAAATKDWLRKAVAS